MAGFDDADLQSDPSPGLGERLARLMSLAGAFVSVALVAGLAFWGYRLAMRDVTGVPVIRALQGPMRVAPEDPGGETASYQGLAVNRVAADGEAAPPPDRLVLAPRPTALADEDMTVGGLTASREAAAEPAEEEAAAAEDAADAEAVDDAVQAALAAPAPDIPPTAAIDAPTRLSPELRPMPRPARIARAATPPAALTPAAVTTAPAAAEEIDPARLKADARLVQLGAFDDADAARKEWQRLSARFGTYLAGKSRVIQEAQSGGRTFFRLRAAGFSDDADARRFCAALLAEQAACIPVPAR